MDLTRLARGDIRDALRIRVTGDLPTLMVDGTSRSAAGEVMDVSLHPASTAHQSGTYPIPSLENHDVRTTIVNISNASAEIAAQYFWDGGTFAVPIFSVPAGGTFELDPKKIADDGLVDLAGRYLNPAGSNLALKWTRWSGSQELIGRTETRPIGSSDAFGFNCGGCCWQIPDVAIEPSEVELGLGEAPLFQAVLYQHTCTGLLGPWASSVTSASVPFPFSWNFTTIVTSDGADDFVSFSTLADQIDHMCLYSKESLFAIASAKACKKVFNPNNYDKDRTCSEQTNSCTTCQTCCDHLYQMKICQKFNQIVALNEKNACLNVCAIDRCS